MASRRPTTARARQIRRRRTVALALGVLIIIVAVAGTILVQYLRSPAEHPLVLSSPYIARIQIGPSHCLHSHRRCPEAAAWPVVSDSTTPGYVVGDTLSTTSGSWFKSTGGAVHPVTGYAYRWQRCRGERDGCSAIDGANQPTYTLTPGDVDLAIRAVVTARSTDGSTVQASAATPRIGGTGRNSACRFGMTTPGGSAGGGLVANGDRVMRTTPSASGPLTALSMYLRASGTGGAQTIRGVIYADANGAPGALLAVSHQLVFSKGRTEGWYTLTLPTSLHLMASVPYWIGSRTGLNSPTSPASGQSASASASNEFPICGIQAPPGSPASTIAPPIADITTPGAWAAGDRLTASSGSWSPAALAYSYQWQHCDPTGTDCTDITGATASTYLLAADQLGGTVRVVVRATNGTGSGSASSALSGAGPRDVSRTPNGPATPRAGWSVAYADAFSAPLGTGPGQDNTVWPSRFNGNCSNNRAFNSNEMEVFNCSQVTIDPHGLELTCAYAPNIVSGKNYNCGAINTGGKNAAAHPTPGYRLFQFMPGHGREWAIQIIAKFPPNTGEADPGWWLTDPRWTWELDMFEGFGASAGSGGSWCHAAGGNGWIGVTDPTWIYNTETRASIGANQMFCRDAQPSPFDPSAGYHTYTTVIHANNTISEYIDGHIQVWDYVPNGGSAYVNDGTVIGPPGALPQTYGGLIVSYSLRDIATGNPDPHFLSGARSFSVRSIAVYASATGGAADAVNAGLVAPGTDLSP
jgi:hypothetical protein